MESRNADERAVGKKAAVCDDGVQVRIAIDKIAVCLYVTMFLNCTKLILSCFSSFSKRDAKFAHAVPECTGVCTQMAGSPIWAIDSVVTQQENIFDMIPHHLIQGWHVLFETGA